MIALQLIQKLLRRRSRIDFGRDALEPILVAMQILVASLQQLVQGHIHHLVVGEFPAIGLGADAKIAVGAGQEHRSSGRLLAFSKSITAWLIFLNSAIKAVRDALERFRHVALKTKRAGSIQRDFGINLRRVLQILRADWKTRGMINSSRAIADLKRSGADAKVRLMMTKIAFVTLDEYVSGFFSHPRTVSKFSSVPRIASASSRSAAINGESPRGSRFLHTRSRTYGALPSGLRSRLSKRTRAGCRIGESPRRCLNRIRSGARLHPETGQPG